MYQQSGAAQAGVHCHVGSLEIDVVAAQVISNVHCHVGSLENLTHPILI